MIPADEDWPAVRFALAWAAFFLALGAVFGAMGATFYGGC
jgi:hypothetical protein